MNVFSLLGHLGLLIHMGKDVNGIIQNLVQKKEKMPSSDEFHTVVQDAIELLQSGLLNLPADVQNNMISALQQVEAQFWPVAPSPAPAA